MYRLTLIFIIIIFLQTSCNKGSNSQYINKEGKTIGERISCPENYSRKDNSENSWEYFLQNLPLQKYKSEILDFKGNPIKDQRGHIAIIDYSVGEKDLQQCADAIIRLRAEYLYSTGQFNMLKFHFTSVDLYSWIDHSKGIRAIVNGNKVSFEKKAKPDSSYNNFTKYLEVIFMYAGTISLEKEISKIEEDSQISIGDIIVVPGSPGHAVIIVDEAVNSKNEKKFLITEGFMPTQSIHVLTNFDTDIGPWYKIKTKSRLKTAQWKY